MRALLITLEGIKEVQIGAEFEKTRLLLEKRPIPKKESQLTLSSMYRFIGCDRVIGAGYPDENHACWADDEALLNSPKATTPITRTQWYSAPLVGNLLVTGISSDGGTTPATLNIEELQKQIIVMPLFEYYLNSLEPR
jgi:hypothetical protein